MNVTRSLTTAEITTTAAAVAGWHAEGQGWCRLTAAEMIVPGDGGEFRCVSLKDRRTAEPVWAIIREGGAGVAAIFCDEGKAFPVGSLEEALRYPP